MSSIASYEFLARVATGSTGTVWKARHIELGRIVAIKELSTALRQDAQGLQRFRSEATRLAELDDEHVVKVFDYVEDESGAYIIEEWVAGETLEAVLARVGRLRPEQSVGVMRGGLLGLAAAHDQRLVHGDVSLSNIILDAAGTSKMIDFGLAGQVGDSGRYGTPAFMSPEAVSGAGLLPASDVYSAAAVLFTLLSGRPPRPGPEVAAVLRQHLTDPPPALRGHGSALRDTLKRAMAKDPNARPPDARAFLDELEESAKRRFGAAWLTRASTAGLVGGGVSESVLQAGAGDGAAAKVVAPIIAEALDEEPAPVTHENATAARRSLHRRRRILIAGGGVFVLAAAATVAAFAFSGGSPKHAVASTIHSTPSPAKPTHTAKPVVLVRPAGGATVTGAAAISTSYVVSGACSGQGGFKTYYRFSGARVKTSPNYLALRLVAVPGADYITSSPVIVTCPGFTFPLTGNGVDKVLTSGSIGQTVRLVATDVTNSPGLPPNIGPDRVYVVIDAVPQFIGKGLPLSSCNATAGAEPMQRPAYPCLPANTSYRISLPVAAAATTCEGKPSTTVSPVDVSCHSTGTLTIVIRTYAAAANSGAATPTPSG